MALLVVHNEGTTVRLSSNTSEAIHIKKHDPDLNRRYEEDKCQSLLYLDLDESERAAIRQQRGQQ